MTQIQRPVMPRIEAGRRAAIKVDDNPLVSFGQLLPDATLPLLCTPRVSGVSLADWARGHRPEIDALLLKHGAILFRGFAVADTQEFNACIDAISGGALEYSFRASPRTQIDGRFNIYTSTDYPANELIFPHNEHAYSPEFPLQLYFYCNLPSATGGETPLGSTREVARRVPAHIREKFCEKGIMYVRNYGDGMGLPWQTVFQTEDRSRVESYCRSVGISAEWKSDGRLRTRQIGAAVLRHPQTGESVWFNHGTFFNALTLPASMRQQLLREFGEEDLPQNTFYGDGSSIEPDVIEVLQAAYRDVMVEFPWEQGDVVLLDNMLTVHGRNSFTGARRIMTGMARRLRSVDLQVRA